jgi:hypothetical protein
MTHFHETELIDGNPTTAGLRRVAELLLGDIIDSRPLQVFPVQSEALGRATVVYAVTFDWKLSNSGPRTYADVADVWEGNTDDMFSVHAPATASTRAEGRALRKALKLRVLAAEEVSSKDSSKVVAETTNADIRITKDQINFINLRARKYDIDVMKFLNSNGRSCKSVYEFSKDEGVKIVRDLSSYSSKDEVPEEIRNYKEDWMKK